MRKLIEILYFNPLTEFITMELRNRFLFSNRINSILIDIFYVFIPLMPFWLILGLFIISFDMSEKLFLEAFKIIQFVLISISAFFFLNKDNMQGRSIAKRICGFQIIDIKTGIAPTNLKCIIRNSTIFIYPIEIIFIAFYPKQRLGDFIAGTAVVETIKLLPKTILTDLDSNVYPKISVIEVLVTIIIIVNGFVLGSVFSSMVLANF
ncbi:MAG TPA: hypothetical protein DCQ31_01940 [Bacteroidales bacterium]|nr:hypothetical protein [Bacteroidales bacterium]